MIENGVEHTKFGTRLWEAGMTVEPQKTPRAVPTSKDKSAGRPVAELKVYGGKTFDQWREIARTDLDDATRVKAFEALEAFAGSGKSDEAAAAIVEALKVDQSPAALKAAYRTLRAAGPQGEAAIIRGIRDKDPAHRRAAI